MAGLTVKDHEAIAYITKLTGEALHLLRELEERLGQDHTGPALAALTRAEASLEFVPRELSISERYLA
jgi:hypothetical protein